MWKAVPSLDRALRTDLELPLPLPQLRPSSTLPFLLSPLACLLLPTRSSSPVAASLAFLCSHVGVHCLWT